MNLQEQIDRMQEMMGLVNEGLKDTSWEDDNGNKVTLIDLLNVIKDIPVTRVPLTKIKPHLLTWDGDKKEDKKIEKADLRYPILIFINDKGKFLTIIDGHHRAHKAIKKGLKNIKVKLIPINSLPKEMKKVFKDIK
jgi:hypothetical protein